MPIKPALDTDAQLSSLEGSSPSSVMDAIPAAPALPDDDGTDDPDQVFDTLPPAMQAAFDARDLAALDAALATLSPEELRSHMDRCVRAASHVHDVVHACAHAHHAHECDAHAACYDAVGVRCTCVCDEWLLRGAMRARVRREPRGALVRRVAATGVGARASPAPATGARDDAGPDGRLGRERERDRFWSRPPPPPPPP